ncbi:hypothetical protein [Rickettsia felis]|nr:hypothetical protein [Rickettsia felis]
MNFARSLTLRCHSCESRNLVPSSQGLVAWTDFPSLQEELHNNSTKQSS